MELTTSTGEVFEVYTAGQESQKAVLIIHDWWGVLDYNKEWADQCAALGYHAWVIDLFNGYCPKTSKEASEHLRTLDQDMLNRKLSTALTTLRTPERKVAVLGWSFGGLHAQAVTLMHPELVDALIIFYCRIILDKHNSKTLHCPTLAFFSETEKTWPDKQAALEHALAEAEKTLECHSYDADHGFVNSENVRHDNDASEDTWQKTVKFLEKYLA
jgi:carboxymethylenebutenolidase